MRERPVYQAPTEGTLDERRVLALEAIAMYLDRIDSRLELLVGQGAAGGAVSQALVGIQKALDQRK